MGESASQIAEELDRKRAEASEKISMIEQQATDKVEDVREEVMEAMDLRKQIEERPLVALGLAFTSGIVLGGLTGGNDDDRPDTRGQYEPMSRTYGTYNGGRGQSSSSGLMHNLRQMAKNSGLEDSINSAATAMMASAGERIKTSLNASDGDSSRSSGHSSAQNRSVGSYS